MPIYEVQQEMSERADLASAASAVGLDAAALFERDDLVAGLLDLLDSVGQDGLDGRFLDAVLEPVETVSAPCRGETDGMALLPVLM